MGVSKQLHEQLATALCLTIAQKRQELQISQGELSRRSGLNRSFISDVERGSRNLSIKTVFRLAHALDLPASTLMLQAEKSLDKSSHP